MHLARRCRANRPATPVETGIRRFVEWYLEYYKTQAPQPTRVTNLG